jgi:hypothetical protein
MFTKEVKIDQITVVENGTVFYREVTKVFENGVELSKNYARSSVTPDKDISGLPVNVQAICSAAWTAEVVAAFQAAQAANAS